jgi:hypothetical protein
MTAVGRHGGAVKLDCSPMAPAAQWTDLNDKAAWRAILSFFDREVVHGEPLLSVGTEYENY